jgi:UDP-glucose:glycoprotein glucosyltransferase
MLTNRSYPVRLVVVPIVETEEGAKMARMSYYLTQKYGSVAMMQFFGALREPYSYIRFWICEVGESWSWTGPTYRRNSRLPLSQAIKEGEAISFDSLVGGTSEFFEAKVSKARAYANRPPHRPTATLFINENYYVLDDVRPAPNFSTELHLVSGRTSWACGNPVTDRRITVKIADLGNGERLFSRLSVPA